MIVVCLFCRAALGDDARVVRRDYPNGSPCPRCGSAPLVLDFAPVQAPLPDPASS